MRCPYIPYNIITGNATTIADHYHNREQNNAITIGNAAIIGNFGQRLFPFPLLILFMVISSDKGPNQPCGNREIRIKREIHNLFGFKVLLLDANQAEKLQPPGRKIRFNKAFNHRAAKSFRRISTVTCEISVQG